MIKQITRFITGIFLFSFLCAQFTLQESESDKTLIQFTHEDITFESQGEYTKLVPSQGGTTTDYGQPELPLFSTLIQVESDKEYSVSFNILSSHTISDIRIFPFQNKDKTEAPGVIKYMDASFYSGDVVYPVSILEVSDRLVMRDLHLLNISVVPYRYHPSQQTLEVIDAVEIEVVESGERDDGGMSERLPSRVFESMYSTLVLNYVERDRDTEFQDPAILYICGGSSENNSSFQQLVEWRHQRGYVVYTANLSETGSSSSSIKNYIQNAYNNFDPSPEYVAFVGDVGGSYSVPTFYEDWGHDYWGDQCEGDQPYSQLNGNDLFPEVLVGRISVRSSSNISNIVNKIIHYEKATYMGDLNEFYERAAVMGDPGDSGLSTVITARYVENVMEAYGVEDVRIKISGSSWTSWMENRLEEGVAYFQYRGFYGVSGFDNGDIDDANNGHRLPFATVLTCGTGSFAQETTCLSEQFLKAGSVSSPKGAVAAVSTATGNTHTMFNNIIAMGIYDGIFPKKVGTAGAALSNGKLTLYSAYPNNPYNWVNAFCQWNSLMGDPSTHLWTDTPEILEVNYNEDIPFGTNYIEIEVLTDTGEPVDMAMVTLLKGNDEIFINGLTDENGRAVIHLGYQYGGQLSVTVTKQDCKPFIGTATIITEGKLVNLDNIVTVEINDEGGDGLWNPGETAEIAIPLYNYGFVGVSGVTAEITTTAEYMDIIEGSAYYGSMGVGQSQYGEAFTVSLSPSAMEREELKLYLIISDDSGEEWHSILNMNCVGTHLIVSGYSVFHPNGLEPGETSDIQLTLYNSGFMPTENLTGTLLSIGPEIQIISPQANWNPISSGLSAPNQDWFTIKPLADLIPGTVLGMKLTVESDNGFYRDLYFSLEVGEVSVSDPFGPDSYGYYIYDSGDSGYDLSPDYDWVEISSIGENLDIYDVGNGRGVCSENSNVMCDSDADCDPWGGAYYGYCVFAETTKEVDLPFTFRFYGVDYSSVSVSSNGWIAFGDSELESFRNYPIPGAGGPSPMLAVFWDDLKTSNGGDVYTFSDPGNEYFIVEWSNVRTQNYNSLNSFQAILYNQTAPPYDDNEIKLQYKTFNNTSSGSYAGYTPNHGGYATIGLENHASNIGLEYSFYNEYPTAAMELDDHDALFITTRPNIDFSDVTVPVSFMGDWSLIGLPVQVENPNFSFLFPDAIDNTLYSFNGSYVSEDILVPGSGFWLRFESGGSVDITGGNILDQAINLSAGWNLVSGVSQSVYLNDISDPDGLIIPGTLYGYGESGYIESWILEPGKGYWVRSYEEGIIFISGRYSGRVDVPSGQISESSFISFNGRKLFLNSQVSPSAEIQFTLPPKPPSGAFDVRFSGDTKLCTTGDCLIEVMSPYNSLNISYDVSLNIGKNKQWVLTLDHGKDYILEGAGEISVPSMDRFTLEKKAVAPVLFTLHQNFPNPFNPITALRYDLPEEAFVTLIVYDMLGVEIIQLINTTQEAGFKSVQWNATDSMGIPVSAGVYLYKIQAGEFVETRKMVLLK